MHRRYLSSTIIVPFNYLKKLQINPTHRLGPSRTLTVETTKEPDANGDHLYADIPKPAKSKSERKPYLTPMKILVRRAKQEREARKAQPCKLLEEPPGNGLLVPELVGVAHQVYRARESVLLGLSKLVKAIPVLRCRHCFEVHIGPVGHEIRTCTGPKSGLRNATHVWRRGRVHDVIYFPKCFHLYDRVGKPRIIHNESRAVKQLPAIVELCIQAGLNLENYPTKRRTRPVYSIEGRIVDFELDPMKKIETNKLVASEDTKTDSSLKKGLCHPPERPHCIGPTVIMGEVADDSSLQNGMHHPLERPHCSSPKVIMGEVTDSSLQKGTCHPLERPHCSSPKVIMGDVTDSSLQKGTCDSQECPHCTSPKIIMGEEGEVTDSSLDVSLTTEMQPNLDLANSSSTPSELATMTLDSWFEMISGAKKMMERYKVHTCGYCPEVQVGPKGHKVRMCKASKHQSRNGMHAWQEATIFDLVGPNYVWHVADPSGSLLSNGLKRYYGKAPAVVELCVQAGAPVPAEYRSMMRLDVVPPCPDELDLVT
ncbi:APO protein 3, mitochondrial [Cynara cardunculus var. scolymus]|uniref:APO protein 3, mitochondrial n=1 Tax=Cynara cardunculus var. scolymus TaxID=59895 RepID=UPI000D624DD6|nr:APO protein 3, mitochondrial [Cynara cardunculus var. scolymus]XP_024996714.1 APO protein 3, mitochondrial [Cynara cardunculus var. scolymus]